MVSDGKRLLVIADGIFPRDAVDVLSKRFAIAHVERIEEALGKYTGARIFRRHAVYFKMAFQGYRRWKTVRPDYLVIWQQYIGFYFSLIALCDITRLFSRPHSLSALFYVLPKRKFVNRIVEFILASGPIDMVVYAAHSEYERSCAGSKRRILPYADAPLTDAMLDRIKTMKPIARDYLFSGGASNRDYVKIRQAACAMPQTIFAVVAVPGNIAGIQMPDNVKIFHSAPDELILSLIYHARCVIVPVKDPSVTSGQIMILRALELGKPVITNLDRIFIKEWLATDGEAGVIHFDTDSRLALLLDRIIRDGLFYDKNREAVSRIYDSKARYAEWVARFADMFER